MSPLWARFRCLEKMLLTATSISFVRPSARNNSVRNGGFLFVLGSVIAICRDISNLLLKSNKNVGNFASLKLSIALTHWWYGNTCLHFARSGNNQLRSLTQYRNRFSLGASETFALHGHRCDFSDTTSCPVCTVTFHGVEVA